MRNTIAVAFSVAVISLVPRIVRAGCEFDSQCKGDRVCEAGVCVAPPAPPQSTCVADADCAGDAICDQGVCHPPASTQPPRTDAPGASTGSATAPSPTSSSPPPPSTGAAPASAAPPAVGPPPPPSTVVSSPAPAPAMVEPLMVKQLGLSGFLSPASSTMFVGLQADLSMASRGAARSPLLGATVGLGWHGVTMGDQDVSVSSIHLGAWIGYQTKVNSITTYRVKAGGLMIRDDQEQLGAGALLAGETQLGRFLTGLDLWITSSANVLVRIGVQL